MPFYENVMIARPDISSAQMEALTETMAGIIKEHGGEVSKTEHWGLRNLAYRIKKNRKGHYALMNIDAPAEAVREMERNMRISEDVIRFLTVRVNELDPNQSAILQSRGSRDDRPGRGGRGGRDRDGRERDGRDRDGREREGREREGRETREAREGRERDESGRRAAADAGPARGAAEGKSE